MPAPLATDPAARRQPPRRRSRPRATARTPAPRPRASRRPATRSRSRDQRPSVDRIGAVTPPLVDVAHVLNRAVNELGYNPPGPEEGYLFWLAWFAHNSGSMLSIQDAHGAVWRGLVMVGCSSAGTLLASNPALAPLANSPI